MIICKIDNTEHKDYRRLHFYLKNVHSISCQEYYDKFFPHFGCKECGKECTFLNIKKGYRVYCSVLCLNRFKSKDPKFLKILSESLVGIKKNKHSQKTKDLCRRIMLKEWKINRTKRLSYMTDEVKLKISKSVSQLVCAKKVTFKNNIRCESKSEELFVEHCIKNSIDIKRFEINGQKSIKLEKNWRVPDYICNNTIVEVKDFHVWFRKELKDGLKKYYEIEEWCLQNGFLYIFWFKKLGYKTINEILKEWQDTKQKIKN